MKNSLTAELILQATEGTEIPFMYKGAECKLEIEISLPKHQIMNVYENMNKPRYKKEWIHKTRVELTDDNKNLRFYVSYFCGDGAYYYIPLENTKLIIRKK